MFLFKFMTLCISQDGLLDINFWSQKISLCTTNMVNAKVRFGANHGEYQKQVSGGKNIYLHPTFEICNHKEKRIQEICFLISFHFSFNCILSSFKVLKFRYGIRN